MYLAISGCQIATLGPDAFSNQHSMVVLDLSFNEIGEVFSHMFQNSRHIKSLLFQRNQIQKLNIFLLHGISSLILMNMSSNRINVMESGCFKHVLEVISLDLSYNLLVKISQDSISEIGVLHNLNLTHNNLLQIHMAHLYLFFCWRTQDFAVCCTQNIVLLLLPKLMTTPSVEIL